MYNMSTLASSSKVSTVTSYRERHQVQMQLLQDSLDMVIPASSLKLVDVGDSVVGLAG